MNIKDKVVIITGASSGIGKELGMQFAKAGSKVVLAARNEAALKQLADQINQSGGTAYSYQTDVSKKYQVEFLVKAAMDKFGRVDIFINNAGVSLAQGIITENKEEDIRQTMEINFMAGIFSVWAAAPIMEKQGGGQIVFISSCIGKRGVPRNAVYCASKFAVQGLTEAIRLELRKKNIRVITICPPGVDTPFFENNQKGVSRTHRLHPVGKIAAEIVGACKKEKREVLQTMDSKLLHWLSFFFPQLMDWALAKNKRV